MIRKILKFYYGDRTVTKKYAHFNKYLRYKANQHLIFAFKKTIIYENDIQQKLPAIIKKGDLIFDIGSNIGQYALPFSDLVGVEGKVICYEPDIDNFNMLETNIKLNHLSNIVLNNKGISSEAGVLLLYKDNETGGRTSSFDQNFNPNFKDQTVKVEVSTLFAEIEKYGEPSLIKIDVEGFEYKIIQGLLSKNINSDYFVEVRKETKQDIFNILTAKGYRCFNLDTPLSDPMAVEIHAPENVSDFCNLYFKKIDH